jgi:hypothetical protein
MIKVARRLGSLRDEMVFVGGSVVSLLIDDPASTPVRPTDDLDLIVEASSRQRYDALSARLHGLGFQPDHSEDAPLCRWRLDDVMPTSPDILGFSNRWYPSTITHAIECELEPGLSIRIATAPHFIAMKLEAFAGRGKGDYMSSHDLEDIIALVDARATLVDEIDRSVEELRSYLASKFASLLEENEFVDAVPGHLAGDSATQARLPLVLERLREISGLS